MTLLAVVGLLLLAAAVALLAQATPASLARSGGWRRRRDSIPRLCRLTWPTPEPRPG